MVACYAFHAWARDQEQDSNAFSFVERKYIWPYVHSDWLTTHILSEYKT